MVHIVSGTVVTIAGGAAKGIADGVGTAARFNALLSIEFDSTGTIAYVCDGGNHAIRQITPQQQQRDHSGWSEGRRRRGRRSGKHCEVPQAIRA